MRKVLLSAFKLRIAAEMIGKAGVPPWKKLLIRRHSTLVPASMVKALLLCWVSDHDMSGSDREWSSNWYCTKSLILCLWWCKIIVIEIFKRISSAISEYILLYTTWLEAISGILVPGTDFYSSVRPWIFRIYQVEFQRFRAICHLFSDQRRSVIVHKILYFRFSSIVF